MIQTIAKSAQSPLYVELADSLQQLIEQGTLRPGHRVPSVRRMALQRDVSISTVLQAYTVLENRGFLEARPQSGYYVRPRLVFQAPEPRIARPMAKPAYVGMCEATAESVIAAAADPTFIQLGTACPDASLFPNKKLARLLGTVARNDPLQLGRYTMNRAHEPLAREISRRYLQAGVALSHEDLVITVGCTEAVNLSLRAVTKPGDTVALETPAYFGILEIIQSLNLRVLEIPTDSRDGLCLDALREACAQNDVKALFVMPSFQNPLGSCMPDAKKERLYDVLREFDIPAIEDDIYGDLHFSEKRPKPLKAWDADGRVMLCSSFDKTLAPSMRVGWVSPGRYFDRVRRLKFTNTMGTPIVLQKTIAGFLRDGGYDHHLRSIRRAYQNQLHLVSQTILRHFPAGTRLTRPQGGFVLWIELPTGVDTRKLQADAVRHRISTAPGTLFTVKDRYHNCMRINCGLPWTPEIEQAMRTLGDLARKQLV